MLFRCDDENVHCVLYDVKTNPVQKEISQDHVPAKHNFHSSPSRQKKGKKFLYKSNQLSEDVTKAKRERKDKEDTVEERTYNGADSNRAGRKEPLKVPLQFG